MYMHMHDHACVELPSSRALLLYLCRRSWRTENRSMVVNLSFIAFADSALISQRHAHNIRREIQNSYYLNHLTSMQHIVYRYNKRECHNEEYYTENECTQSNVGWDREENSKSLE